MLKELKGIEQFRSLKSLSLNFNQIGSVNELQRISRSLRELNIRSNPALQLDRQLALSMFPKLEVFNGE
jgi:Leucine-rich repeat (LRR) protein